MRSASMIGRALAFASVAATLWCTSTAYADDAANQVSAKEVEQALAGTPGVLAASDSVAAIPSSDAAAVVTANDATTDIPKHAEDGVQLSNGTTTVTVTPPNAVASDAARTVSPGVVAYPSTNGSATAVQATETGTVRMLTVIASPDAATDYSFPVTVPDGGRLELTDDGGAAVTDGSGAVVATFAPPWAHDNNGQKVSTHYTVTGNSLVQVVDHTADGVQYPVVADPWFGIRLIDHVRWSGSTLQVIPTWWGRYGAGIAARWSAWDEVVRLAPRVNRSNTRDQFLCHWDVVRVRAPNKASWNLDINRPDVGYWRTVWSQCNP